MFLPVIACSTFAAAVDLIHTEIYETLFNVEVPSVLIKLSLNLVTFHVSGNGWYKACDIAAPSNSAPISACGACGSKFRAHAQNIYKQTNKHGTELDFNGISTQRENNF